MVSSKRILLVEDDTDVRDMLGEVLSRSGHEVISATDGADGLRRMRECHPDVVVLDLMMPTLDGWEFRILQRKDPMLANTPVVVISASNQSAAAAVDADLYLKKPLDAATLLKGIDQVIATQTRKDAPTKIAQSDRLAVLGTLAAGLAHEINNPLTYVLLQLGQALRGAEKTGMDDVATSIRGALEGAERIRSIMAGIRTFSRPDDARLEQVDVTVPIDAALKLVMNEVRHRATLVRSYEDPPRVVANEQRLGQVFLNLLTNAAHALPEGDPKAHQLRVRAYGDDGKLVVEISDTGHGIPPHLVDRVFEPYFSTKPIGEGTGLGLSISRDIITGLGGAITVTSTEGRGTTFRVTLPAVPAPDDMSA